MKIADYLRLQRDFDRFALSVWRSSGKNVLKSCAKFIYRVDGVMHGDESEDLGAIVEARMKAFHIRRRPDITKWGYFSIGAWLFASYPELFDRIATVGDASKIDLSTLRYVADAPVPKKSKHPRSREHMRTLQKIQLNASRLSCKGGGNKTIRKR